MMELTVVLDFACCACEQSVNVTVKCEGKGLAADDGAQQPVAAVHIPCPNCGSVNKVCFEPDGTVRAVAPQPSRLRWLEPSLN
jgi:hypothetical protein